MTELRDGITSLHGIHVLILEPELRGAVPLNEKEEEPNFCENWTGSKKGKQFYITLIQFVVVVHMLLLYQRMVSGNFTRCLLTKVT